MRRSSVFLEVVGRPGQDEQLLGEELRERGQDFSALLLSHPVSVDSLLPSVFVSHDFDESLPLQDHKLDI